MFGRCTFGNVSQRWQSANWKLDNGLNNMGSFGEQGI